ncbi:MAG TPA: hypothetical protein VMS93_12210, partial [Candidatus Saccharimonadales bacterium]|nr:hypothetical protein [Candidatus Saccharimonadales bacterium]
AVAVAAAPGAAAAAAARPASAPGAGAGEAVGKFSISGRKTLALENGSNRDVAVHQSLDLSLGGEVGRDLSVVAVLSDRNLPLTPEGRTQDLGNLDKVVVEVKSPGFGASLGDYDLTLNAGQYGSVQRTVQGVRAQASTGQGEVEAAAALSKGEFLSRQFLGEEGRQGPYVLSDPAGRPNSPVVPGTERVWLDGERMRRGDDADYTVDYSLGEITFTARRPIHPGSRIAVDYQYAADEFRRTVTLARGGWRWGDTGSFRVAWMREADDPGQPQGASLTPEDLAALQHAAPGGNVVTNGAHYLGPGQGDYRKVAAGTADEHFQYAGRDSGDYQVDFMAALDGQGSYADSLAGGGLVYAWRGAGKGSYLPGRVLPVPSSHGVADFGGALRMGALRLEGEGALSFVNGNLLGPGGQSNGAAWNLAAHWGGQAAPGAAPGGPLELELRAERQEDRFEPLGRSLAPFAEEDWNLAAADRTRGRTVLTSALRYRLDTHTSVGLELGSWRTGGQDARRWTWSSVREGALAWRASWAAISNQDSLGGASGSRNRGSFELRWGRGSLQPDAHWSHDAARDSAGRDAAGYDEVGGGLRWTGPRGLAAQAQQSWRRDFGVGLGTAADPLRSSTQRLAVTYAGSPDWSLAASASQRVLAGTADSLGATRNAQLQFLLHREAWDGEARYEIAATRATGRARQVVFVGSGLGAYDSLGNYTGRGDYNVSYYNTGTDDATNQATVNARLEWSGERAGRSDWLRHVALRSEVQATQTARRAGGGGLLAWPGAIPDDPTVLTGNGVFRQDVEWNEADGHAGLRLRHEWTGSADRQYAGYGQVRRGRTESARLRLSGRRGTSLELESNWRTRETALGPTGAAASYQAQGTDHNLNLRWAPSAAWSGSLSGRLLSERDPQTGAASRQVELSPGVALARGGRFRAELRGTRISVSETGSIVPGFDNYGTLLRSRTEHDLTLTYQVHAAVQASVLAHGSHPDGGSWVETARFEMRALF